MPSEWSDEGDLLRLLGALGLPGFPYRELGREGRDKEAIERWPLLGEAVRRLRALPKGKKGSGLRAEEVLAVAVVSPCGGAGRSTVVAEVAGALWEEGRRAVAVDFDPAGGLGICLGRIEPSRREEKGDEWDVHLGLEESEGPLYVSYAEWIAEVGGPPGDAVSLRDASFASGAEFLLFDAPSLGSPWFSQVIREADLVLTVLPPRPSALFCLATLQGAIFFQRRELPIHHLLNGFDAKEPLCRDVASALRLAREEEALKMLIHEDPVIRESHARRRTLQGEAPHSQSLHELRQVTQWLMETGARLRKEASSAVGQKQWMR